MKALHIIGIVVFSLLLLVGIGATGNDGGSGAAAWCLLAGMFGVGYSVTSLVKHRAA